MNVFTTLQHLIPQQALSNLAGRLAENRHPLVKKAIIEAFARAYRIHLTDYERQNLAEYDNFNDFFTRELKSNARPIDQTTGGIVCPADGTISQLGTMTNGKLLQAKGKFYDAAQLLANYDEAQTLIDGKFATIYLAPNNYHRVHMPFSGTLVKTRYIPGSLFSVNHTTAENIPDLFARNERLVCQFQTDFGTAYVILVGAMIVAGIETVATGRIERTVHIQEETHNLPLEKGAELGRFYLGSTAIVLLPKLAQNQWLSQMSAGKKVKMGELLGIASAQSQSAQSQADANENPDLTADQ